MRVRNLREPPSSHHQHTSLDVIPCRFMARIYACFEPPSLYYVGIVLCLYIAKLNIPLIKGHVIIAQDKKKRDCKTSAPYKVYSGYWLPSGRMKLPYIQFTHLYNNRTYYINYLSCYRMCFSRTFGQKRKGAVNPSSFRTIYYIFRLVLIYYNLQ